MGRSRPTADREGRVSGASSGGHGAHCARSTATPPPDMETAARRKEPRRSALARRQQSLRSWWTSTSLRSARGSLTPSITARSARRCWPADGVHDSVATSTTAETAPIPARPDRLSSPRAHPHRHAAAGGVRRGHARLPALAAADGAGRRDAADARRRAGHRTRRGHRARRRDGRRRTARGASRRRGRAGGPAGDGQLYRVRFRLAGDDPRIALRERGEITPRSRRHRRAPGPPSTRAARTAPGRGRCSS